MSVTLGCPGGLLKANETLMPSLLKAVMVGKAGADDGGERRAKRGVAQGAQRVEAAAGCCGRCRGRACAQIQQILHRRHKTHTAPHARMESGCLPVWQPHTMQRLRGRCTSIEVSQCCHFSCLNVQNGG